MSQKLCDKAVSTNPSTIKFAPECFMIQEMCEKAVRRCFFVFVYIPDQYKTQEMCDRVVSEDSFSVDDSLAWLKLIPNLFVTSKMIKELFTAFYEDENILYFNEDSSNVVFSCNEMGIFKIDLKNINPDDNFDEDDIDSIIHIWLLAWHIKFEKRKAI